jgi:NADH dehydrogenase
MDIPNIINTQKRVVIIGAGFAGLRLAKKLASKYFQIILIDKNNYHQFQPLLYQVATGGLEPSSIIFPLRKIFQKKRNIIIRVTEVTGIFSDTKIVSTETGNIPYDYLILAQGSTTNYFNNNSLQKDAYSMKSVAEALLLRNTMLQNYEEALIVKSEMERLSLLNVVIVGGGPTGVELAGAIAEMKNNILPRDYAELNFRDMHIYLVEAAHRLVSGLGAKSSSIVLEYLRKLGVEVIKNTAVKDYDGKKVLLNNGEIIHSRCLIWSAGVKGSLIAGIPSNVIRSNDRILVNKYNQVEGLPDVFAIGDIALMQSAAFPKGHPQVAQVAIQQANLLAKNLEKIESGKPLVSFHYKDKGNLATVGRNLAVAEIGNIKLRGFVAWFVWMLVHLMSIIGVKNKLFILINWMWQYFTYDQSLRLIIKPSSKENEIRFYEKNTATAVNNKSLSGL